MANAMKPVENVKVLVASVEFKSKEDSKIRLAALDALYNRGVKLDSIDGPVIRSSRLDEPGWHVLPRTPHKGEGAS
jgi:hypothetical protein